MIQIGLVVLALGIVGVIWGIFQKLKAGRVADAPLAKTGDAATRGAEVASPKGALSVEGKVHCAQPLVAPFSGGPCLFYSIKVTAKWKDGETTKTKELEHRKVGAEVFVDDGSGRVRLDLSVDLARETARDPRAHGRAVVSTSRDRGAPSPRPREHDRPDSTARPFSSAARSSRPRAIAALSGLRFHRSRPRPT